MKILTVFNNKGGVGKTTLTYHLAFALSEIGSKVLLVDLDPQCNLSIFALDEEFIADVWRPEDDYIEDYDGARSGVSDTDFDDLSSGYRSVHFLLKPVEDGAAEPNVLSAPISISDNLDLIPGRLTLHLFEAKAGERWSGVYTGDPLAIRTATSIRTLAKRYAAVHGYDVVILDTSPSLGALNRNILSQADGFIIPANPDLFSLYGIRNIGSAIAEWKKQFESIFHFLPEKKRVNFPEKFVRFVGYTLYNAKRLQGSKSTNELGLAKAHFNYAKEIPDTIFRYISNADMVDVDEGMLRNSIGDGAVVYGHNTLPSMAHKYHSPMWRLPSRDDLEPSDAATIRGNRQVYEATGEAYRKFAQDIIVRLGAA